MRTLNRLVLGAAIAASFGLLAPSIANAQPGYGPPPGGGSPGPQFNARRGLMLGFGGHLGTMAGDADILACSGCDYDPLAFGFHFQIGGMLNPRMALLGEITGNFQQLDSFGDEFLVQTQVMVALQYWLTPRFWIKGGIGGSILTVSYDDGVGAGSEDIDEGLAIMGAAGYEIAAGRRFAVDLQLRIASGTYDAIDRQIDTATIGIGVSWFNLLQPIRIGY